MYLIVISEALLFAVNRFTFVSYLLSLSGGLDGKILVFDHLCVLDTVCYSLGLHPFSALNPDCFIRMIFEIVHDISFLLADGTIMCDAYSTLTM